MSATVAEEESHIKALSMNRSYDMRFFKGIFLKPVLLGYDHDEDGNLIINEEEAKTVKLIFLMFMCDYSVGEIAREMTELGRITKIGNTTWSHSSIVGILRNERHCGDVLARKTYTPNFRTHKAVKNCGEKTQYYVKDEHESIVSRDVFLYVQQKLDQMKYGFHSGTPELKVIIAGVLRGFVQINPCWMGFTVEDYLNACASTLTDEDYLNPVIRIRHNKGDYDFRSYQVTRSQFVPPPRRISVSMNQKNLKFSIDAVMALNEIMYVELLVHPMFQMIVVRPGNKKNKHAMKWMDVTPEKNIARRIKAKGFMPILYELFGWDQKYRYTLTGFVKEQGGSKVLVFYADEPEIRIYENDRMTIGYKKEWTGSFGDSYLKHAAKERAMFDPDIEWHLSEEGVIVNEHKILKIPINDAWEQMEALRRELDEEKELSSRPSEASGKILSFQEGETFV
jgi:hypothetical protein